MADTPTHPDLTWRPLRSGDEPGWAQLLADAQKVDGGLEHHGAEDLAEELGTPWLDPEQDTVVGLDRHGRARAFGCVELRPGDVTELRCYAWGCVHPDWRGRGIGRQLLGWSLARAREKAATRRAELDPGVPARFTVMLEQDASATRRLLQAAGLTSRRFFFVMRRELAQPAPDVALPAGLRLEPWSALLDEQVLAAHNEAFTEHWGWQPWTAQAWQQWQSGSKDFRPDWSFVVLDGQEVAGYTMACGRESEWAAQGFTEGWTNLVGVRRPWRGRGLAGALLTASLHAFQAAGLQYAGLDVDAENASGAVGLYERLGYQQRHRQEVYALPI